jgi:hypothetical protein
MSVNEIISQIDAEIASLQKVRSLLASTESKPRKGKGHNMTPEGRARIAAAQRKRWAAQKKVKK